MNRYLQCIAYLIVLSYNCCFIGFPGRALGIKTFKCNETKKIWESGISKKYPIDIQDRALKKLRQLASVCCLADLKNPPSNNFEYLQGNRKGQISIRINRQWRLCLTSKRDGFYDIEIADYH